MCSCFILNENALVSVYFVKTRPRYFFRIPYTETDQAFHPVAFFNRMVNTLVSCPRLPPSLNAATQ